MIWVFLAIAVLSLIGLSRARRQYWAEVEAARRQRALTPAEESRHRFRMDLAVREYQENEARFLSSTDEA